jgi:hypothetical protein
MLTTLKDDTAGFLKILQYNLKFIELDNKICNIISVLYVCNLNTKTDLQFFQQIWFQDKFILK